MTKTTATKRIATVDFESARYLGSEEDGVYYEVAEGKDGWYVSTVVDCNSAHFTDALVTDDGPYATEAAAWKGGFYGAANWCIDNNVKYDRRRRS